MTGAVTGAVTEPGWAAVLVRDMNDVTCPCRVPDEVSVAAGLPGIVVERKPDRRFAHLAGVLTQVFRGADRAAGRQAER